MALIADVDHPAIRKRPQAYLSIEMVAQIFSVHVDTVRKGKGVFGTLTRYKIGRSVRFSREEVEALAVPQQAPRKPRPQLLKRGGKENGAAAAAEPKPKD